MDNTPIQAPARRDANLGQILALGWVTAVALLYLVVFEAWRLPVQCVQLAAGTWPALLPGPYAVEWLRARAVDVVAVGGLVLLAFGLGACVLAWCLPRRDLLGFLTVLGVGLWLVAVAVLAVGAVATAAVRWVYLGLAVWVLPAPRRFWSGFALGASRLSRWGRLLLCLLVVAAVLNLVGAVAPPFEYDELEYHLGAPTEYARAGRIVFLPHNFYSNLPQLTEMLYLLMLTTASAVAAKLVHAMFGVLAALTVYAVGCRLWHRSVGVTAAALFYCLPFVQELSHTARIDLATTFYAAVAFGWILVGRQENQRESLWLAALAAGCAVATKWPAVAVVVLPALLFVAGTWRTVRAVLVFAWLAVLPVMPWLVKNWLLAGNPLYPLLSSWWPSPHWSAAQAALFAAKHYPRFDAVGWWQALERLWVYSFVEPGAVPVLLVVVPLVLALPRRVEPVARAAAVLLALSYAGWFAGTFRPWRFLMPALPVAAWVGAAALDWCVRHWRSGGWLRAAVGVMIVAGLGWCGSRCLVDAEDYQRMPPRMNFVHLVMGHVSAAEFQRRLGAGVFEPIIWMNERLPANARVLFIGEARVHLTRRLVVWATAFDQHPLTAWSNAAGGAAMLWWRLRSEGITHVYVNRSELRRLASGYGYLREANWLVIEDLLARFATPVHEHGAGIVYALRTQP